MDLPPNSLPSLPRSPTSTAGVSVSRGPWARAGRRGARFSILGHSRRPAVLRAVWMGFSVCVLLYSIAVLAHVAWMGTIGVRCLFGTKVEETIPDDYRWDRSRPRVGDSLEAIGSHVIHEGRYSDYIRALRSLSGQVGQ